MNDSCNDSTRNPLSEWILSLKTQVARQNNRRLLVMHGSKDWLSTVLAQLANRFAAERCWLLSDEDVSGFQQLCADKPRMLLGGECDLLAIDLSKGLEPDTLGIISGTLCGGGLLVMYGMPATWGDRAGVFENWIYRCINQDKEVLQIHEGQPLPGLDANVIQENVAHADHNDSPIAPAGALGAAVQQNDSTECITQDQADAVGLIQRVAGGHRHRPLVMTADRGRGKTSALGIAAARLLNERPRRILVTAPRVSAVLSLFIHARKLLPQAKGQAGCLTIPGGEIRFVAPDELIRQAYPCDLLLVDEAAAIPGPMLELLLARYARIVFSSTLHGYEGAGRGFALRFRTHLDAKTPHWRGLHLHQAVRWSDNCPLESWVFNALLLDAEPAAADRVQAAFASGFKIIRMPSASLLAQPDLLRQAFSLLVQAHYQTTPTDLKTMLNHPDFEIWVAASSGSVLGVVLAVSEGGFDRCLAYDIWLGKRRVKGHLMAQSLAAHGGWREAPESRYLRIVRIAVHPAIERNGLGRGLLAELIKSATERGFDVIGSSFGATAELVRFWSANGYEPVQLGSSRDAASGHHSVFVARGLSDRGRSLVCAMQQRFSDQLPQWLLGMLRELDCELVQQLCRRQPVLAAATVHGAAQQSRQDTSDVESYVLGNRGLDYCRPALGRWLMQRLVTGDVDDLEPLSLMLLIMGVLQGRSSEDLMRVAGVTGKRVIDKQLRKAALCVWERQKSAVNKRT